MWISKQDVLGVIIAYFPLRHGLHRKQSLQNIFAAAGKTLPSCYQTTIGGYAGRPKDTRVQQVSYCSVYSLSWEYVNRAVA
jgi:hypothetical protein